MAIDPEKFMEYLKKTDEKRKRGRVTLYLNTEKMEVFRKLCLPVSPSRVIDLFIDQYIEAAKKNKTKSS